MPVAATPQQFGSVILLVSRRAGLPPSASKRAISMPSPSLISRSSSSLFAANRFSSRRSNFAENKAGSVLICSALEEVEATAAALILRRLLQQEDLGSITCTLIVELC